MEVWFLFGLTSLSMIAYVISHNLDRFLDEGTRHFSLTAEAPRRYLARRGL